MHFLMLLEFTVAWPVALVDSLLSNALLAGSAILIIRTLGFYRPSKNKYLYLFVWCVMLSILWALVVRYSLTALFHGQALYVEFLDKSILFRFDIAFLLNGCAAILSMLWYNVEEQREQASRKTDAEKLARDAELYKLRQQLQPHFLFNSLNSISALTASQPEKARKMIQQLSDFLRAALKKEDHQWVSFAEELQHLQLYLDMEKLRFGHRLVTEIRSDENCADRLLPPMLLQPIVENAIKFGLYGTTGEIVIRITAACNDDYLTISVENPFDPETAAPERGTGFGLSSVQRRLYLLFARNDLLLTAFRERQFRTTVKIPRQ